MIRTIRTRLLLTLIGAFVLFTAIAAITYRSTGQLVAVSRNATGTSNALLELEQILSIMQDAETGQRGYLLTGEESYLEPYNRARSDIGANRDRLSALPPALAPSARRLERLIDSQFTLLEAGLRLFRSHSPDSAQSVISGEGKAVMDSLRAVIADMVRTERGALAAGERHARTSGRFAFISVMALSIAGFLVLAALFVAVLRYVQARNRTELALQQERSQLERRIRERTADLEKERIRAEGETMRAQHAALEAETAAAEAAAALNERLTAEQARDRSESQYRALVEQVKDYAIFLLNPDGSAASWNEGVERVLGYAESEFIGLPAAAIFTPEDIAADVPRRELVQAAERGAANNDRWMMRKDGSRFFAAGITTALHDRAGTLIGFSKVMRDQTSWKQTEEALRQSEMRYRLVARASREAIWDWDIVTDRLEWTDGLESLFGYTLEDVEPTNNWWLHRIHPEDRKRVLDTIDGAMDRGDEFWSADYRFLRADGQFSMVTDRGVIARDRHGRPTRMLGTMADITERRRTDEKLAQAQRMEAVGRLAGGVAHDLNNMLTAIVGYSSFLASDLKPDDPRRSDADEIRRAAERSAALTRSLLAFARRELIQPRPLDLNAVVRSMERMLGSALGESIQVDLRLSPEIGTVFADRSRIEQVILNLALNARDAMPGGGRLSIETRSVALTAGDAARHPGTEIIPGHYVRLTVTDTGVGMNSATLARVFEPFFTTKAVGEGTGLGLATVYGTVKQAGGFVWAYSEPGQGAAFTVYLPESTTQPFTEERPPDPPHGASRGKETVLIVEDEEIVRALARRALEAEGYHCLAAANESRLCR